jgi:hypothetical protein
VDVARCTFPHRRRSPGPLPDQKLGDPFRYSGCGPSSNVRAARGRSRGPATPPGRTESLEGETLPTSRSAPPVPQTK